MSKSKPAKFTKILKERGYKQYTPQEFYRLLFPEGELAEYTPNPKQKHNDTWEYVGIIQERTNKTIQIKDKSNPKLYKTCKKVNRYVVCDDLKSIDRAIQTGNFVFMPPCSFVGKRRTDENARFLYALVIEIDDLKTGKTKDKRDEGFKNLLYQFTSEHPICLMPSAVVCSGSGVHLYWWLKDPIALSFWNGSAKFWLDIQKKRMTDKLWNQYVTNRYQGFDVQYQSVTQCYRLVGSRGKKGQLVEAFELSGKRYDISELLWQKGTFCEDIEICPREYTEHFFDESLKSQMDLSKKPKQYTKKQLECIEKYPVWAKENITHELPKRKKGSWAFNRAIYDNFKRRIFSEAKVGHRYYCMNMLASEARSCGIDYEELKADCMELQKQFDSLSAPEPFTNDDMYAALSTYYDDKNQYHKLDYIEQVTGLSFERTKRNGRSQQMHLALLNENKKIRKKLGDTFNEGGRPTAEAAVRQWRQDHPEGTKAQAYSDYTLGLSRPTIRKWWEG